MEKTFAHHKLDAYKVALELAALAKDAAARIPRGHRPLADQLLRASAAVVLLIAEGANRYSAAQKRQRFAEARGEVGEVAANLELLQTFGFVSSSLADKGMTLAWRVAAMMTRLVQKHS